MRRLVVLVACALGLAAQPAGAVSVGVGVFGGAKFAAAQDDVEHGSQYGLRLPVNIVPLVSIEPFFAVARMGTTEAEFRGAAYTRQGFEIVSYGATVILGGLGLASGFPVHPYIGVGAYRLGREGTTDRTDTGWSFGAATSLGLAHGFSLNVRGDFNYVATGDTSRKFADANVGVTFRFFPVP